MKTFKVTLTMRDALDKINAIRNNFHRKFTEDKARLSDFYPENAFPSEWVGVCTLVSVHHVRSATIHALVKGGILEQRSTDGWGPEVRIVNENFIWRWAMIRLCPVCFWDLEQYGVGVSPDEECTACGWREGAVSKNFLDLLTDAAKVGYTVFRNGSSTRITRTIKVNKTATREVGIVIHQDGTAYRIDVTSEIAAGVRSYKVMREILGIN